MFKIVKSQISGDPLSYLFLNFIPTSSVLFQTPCLLISKLFPTSKQSFTLFMMFHANMWSDAFWAVVKSHYLHLMFAFKVLSAGTMALGRKPFPTFSQQERFSSKIWNVFIFDDISPPPPLSDHSAVFGFQHYENGSNIVGEGCNSKFCIHSGFSSWQAPCLFPTSLFFNFHWNPKLLVFSCSLPIPHLRVLCLKYGKFWNIISQPWLASLFLLPFWQFCHSVNGSDI